MKFEWEPDVQEERRKMYETKQLAWRVAKRISHCADWRSSTIVQVKFPVLFGVQLKLDFLRPFMILLVRARFIVELSLPFPDVKMGSTRAST